MSFALRKKIDQISFDQQFIRRAFRFSLTGLFITVVHVLTAIIIICYLSMSPVVGNGVAFVLATIFSYVINTIWSFSARMHGKVLVKFLVVSLIGFFSAMLVAWGAEKLGLSYFFGVLSVVMTIPPMTFLLHNFWTYR